MELETIVDLDRHPITETAFGAKARATLNRDGVLVLSGFIRPETLKIMRAESEAMQPQAYFCTQNHSVYLTPPDPAFTETHAANRQVSSSKGCICDDMIGDTSPLRVLYDAPVFRDFIRNATGQRELHAYADTLSSINIHFANRGQELGWHFDNSSFAITLLIQKPDAGGRFEFVKDMRDADSGDMNYDAVSDLLDGTIELRQLSIEPGDLVLFRGRNSIHRVSPNESDTTRILAVLAYNAEPGIKLSESARMTFFGRLD